MVRSASLFSQLVALFRRQQFYRFVAKHHSERYSKGYSCWDHFVAMLFCQLAQAKSLREICGGLACTMGKLRHFGMKDGPRNRRYLMPILIGHGKCSATCFMIPLRSAGWQPLRTKSFGSRTNCCPWIVP